MKKLIYLIPGLGMGGAEVALLSAIPCLSKSYDFRLLCFGCDPTFVSRLSGEERNCIFVIKGRFGIKYIRAVRHILRFKPDILITSLWRAAFWGIIAKLLNPRTVFVEFIHSTKFFNFADKAISLMALKCCDIAFCDSKSAKQFIQSLERNTRIEVISFLRFDSKKSWIEKQQIQKKALFIGRFDTHKRIDRLVDLVTALAQKNCLFQVDLYGRNAGTMQEIKDKVHKNHLENQISFCGEFDSSKIQKLLANYDFYFQMSDVEGMAMSVAEAMQQGLVSVLTNVGEIQNYAQDGKNAIVFKENFEDDLPRVVQAVLEASSDLSRYNAISKNAWLQFSTQTTYPKSLTHVLSKL